MKFPKIIAGFQESSMCDWKNKLCSVIFLSGCNLNCHYCFNKDLKNEIDIYEVIAKLEKRKKIVKNVVLSGGEASIHPYFSMVLEMLVERGFKVGVHTNCHDIRYILNNLEFISFLGIDLKSDPKNYKLITGKKYPTEYDENLIFKNALYSNLYTLIALAKKEEMGIDYEIRSVISSKHDILNVSNMAKMVGFTNADKYYITSERKLVDGKLIPVFNNEDMVKFQNICNKHIKTIIK